MGRLGKIAFSCICAVAMYTGVSDISKLICINKIDSMTQQDISRALKGARREQLVQAWGEPDYHLCGLYGDIFSINQGGKCLIVCYDTDGVVNKVKVDEGK